METAKILASTAEAAFASDQEGRIVAWNDSAAELTGYSTDDVVGKPCHEVLCGRDLFDNRYCEKNCLIAGMARKDEPIRPFELIIRTASGRRLRARISLLVLNDSDSDRFVMIHLISPVAEETGSLSGDGLSPPGQAGDSPALVSSESTNVVDRLTRREIEVLLLLSTGNTSQEIAHRLYISLPTVRSHVQNILRKLEVHSQIEAVALAFKHGMI